MKKISATRKVIWGFMTVVIVALLVFRIHLERSSEIPLHWNAEASGGRSPIPAEDISQLPEEVPVKVSWLGVDPATGSAAIFLVAEEAKVYMPIFIGPFEASAISRSLEGVIPPRPLTHELLSTVIDGLDAKIERVVVSAMENGTFKAVLVLEKSDGEFLHLDARPSDSIAVALLKDTDIYVAASVLGKAGYKIDDDADIPKPAPERDRRVPPRAPDAEVI